MPPEGFVGQGRFGADAVQKRALEYVDPDFPLRLVRVELLTNRICFCREIKQNARENPIQASAAAKGQNMENLLDIDFDGAAPASSQAAPSGNAYWTRGSCWDPRSVSHRQHRLLQREAT